MRILTQMLKLPLEVFVYSMEMLVKTVQGIQRLADQGIDTVISGVAQAPGKRPGSQSDLNSDTTSSVKEGAISDSAQTTHKEEVNMTRDNDKDQDRSRGSDPQCSDKTQNLLRLYRYKILFVKRGYEVAFDEHEDLVSDDLRDTDFVAWKIAEFIQDLKHIKIPPKWSSKNYPPPPKDPKHSRPDNTYIHWLDEDDKKYLRVYFEILDTYCREPLDYEQQQLNILGDIRDAINKQTTTFGGGTTGGGTGGTGTGGTTGGTTGGKTGGTPAT